MSSVKNENMHLAINLVVRTDRSYRHTSLPCLNDGLIVHSRDIGRSHDEWEDTDTYFQGLRRSRSPKSVISCVCARRRLFCQFGGQGDECCGTFRFG